MPSVIKFLGYVPFECPNDPLGKLRYFKPLRLEIYKKIVRLIKEKGGKTIPLYFCMESESIWRDVLGWIPKGEEDLEAYLSSSLGQ